MVRRVVAIALSAVLVLLSTSAWAECTGWDSAAQGRRACCTHAGHVTTEQGAADCCAGIEQSRHGTVAAHAFHVPSLVALAGDVLIPAAPVVSSRAIVSSVEPVQFASPPPLFLRHVSFLI